MICNCTKLKGAGYIARRRPDQPYDPDEMLLVHSDCLKPTLQYFKSEFEMLAPIGATAILSTNGVEEGIHIHTWATETQGQRIQTMTFHPYPMKVDMPKPHRDGRSILVELWSDLDDAIDQVKVAGPEQIEACKASATAYALVIAKIMHPFYENGIAVLREAQVRWLKRQEGTAADHQSPGLAESIWNPNTRFDGTPYSNAEVKRRQAEAPPRQERKPAAAKEAVKLDDTKIAFIKHSLQTSSLTVEQLAAMLGVEPHVIGTALAEEGQKV